MSGSSRRFSLYGQGIVDDLKFQFVEAVRIAVRDALDIALRNTIHDSSQAAYYWQVGIQGVTNPKDRNPGRGGVTNLKGIPPVGHKGDKGSNSGQVIDGVMAREWETVVEKYIRGNAFPDKVFLYNAVGGLTSNPGDGDQKSYAENAQISSAGEAALAYAARSFQLNMAMGKVRKRPRK